MRQLYSVLVSLVFFLSAFLLWPNVTLATSWEYPFVVWDGYIYVITDEYVEEVNEPVGKVTRYSEMHQDTGNFSNFYKKGTTYFSIVKTDTDEAIAIEESEDLYRKAIREKPYTYEGGGGDNSNWNNFLGDTHEETKEERHLIGWSILLGVLLAIMGLGGYYLFSKRRGNSAK
ncbi:hypothetical protein [Halobacillus sp. H74]|uniref:hypothetical protein n=1 Tax=Halobacillus sp. H74 TaxID=3457436 RepID=UPI003FCD62E7